ncbi:hypothetical protein CK203_050165 [Vitis vinifera]|uniref:Uncharacterized protein n=1 Tax=Vitis vinifera TaxID=29760 RepID=A0A438GYR7_VITVI|nr:hypothetical protein CK203_050165 [Vitis vinifera]
MGSDVVFSSLYLDRSDSVVFGLPGSFMDPHGLARSSLTGCSSRRGHDRYLTEPLRSTQPVRTSRHLDAIMPLHLGGVHIRSLRVPLVLFSGHQGRSVVHRSRLVEPLLAIYSSLRFAAACHTGAYFPHIVSLQSGVQSRRSFTFTIFRVIMSHFSVRCSEPLLSLTFRVITITFLVSVFRAIITTSLSFGVQSRHRFSDRLQSRVLGFGVQSRYHFSASVFRAIITTSLSFGVQSHHRLSDRHSESHPQFRRSELSSIFMINIQSHIPGFGVQSHHYRFSVSMFRAVIGFQIDVQSRVLGFGVQSHYHFSASAFSHHHFSVSAFRAVIGFQIDVQSRVLGFGVQSHYHFSASAFRAITTSQFRRSEPSSVFRSTFRVAFSVSAFRVVITSQLRCSEPSSLLLSVSAFRVVITSQSTFRVPSSVSAFRVVITSQFDVQSHHHHFSVSAFRAIVGFQIDIQSRILGFNVQSHHHHFSVSAFRAIIDFQIDIQSHILEPSSIFRLTFRVASSFSAFRVVIASQFDVQSHHHHFSVSAFRAIIDFQIDIQSRILDRRSESPPRFRRSESLSLLSLTFRVIIITSQFRHSEPSSIFRSTFRVPSSVSAFRVVITSQFDVQSHHHHFSVSAFRAIIDFQIDIQSRILELSSIFRSIFRVISSVSAFRVVITSQFDVQSHHHHFSVSAFRAIIGFQIDIQSRILEPLFSSLFLESALSSRVTTPGVHIHWLCASCLHGFALSLDFSSLRYPVFIVYSSRSPHRVVPFGRILARTPGWCDNYSSLTLISWVAFRDILEGVWVLDAALEGMQGFWAADGMCSRRAEDGLLRKTRGEEEGFCLRGFTQNLWDIATFPIGQVESQQVKGTEKASITLSSMVSLLATPTDVMVDVGIGASLNVLTKGDRALGIAHMPNCTTPDGDIDWDSFCVSLWGPVPISSLPDATTKPPRQGSRELLLDGGVNGVESN